MGAISENQKCRLCLGGKELCKSHVLPEFLYEKMYEDPHKFMLKRVGDKPKIKQKGLYERLLCEDCEQKISRYEDYTSELLKNRRNWPSTEDSRFFTLQDFDYELVKGFFLSILWRSSIAKGPIFEQVNLGVNEEKLRVRLLNSDVGSPRQYSVLMYTLADGPFSLLDDEKFLEEFHFIQSPTRFRFDKNWAYEFVYMGLYIIKIASENIISPLKYDDALLRPNCWRIMPLTKENNPQLYLRFIENAQHVLTISNTK